MKNTKNIIIIIMILLLVICFWIITLKLNLEKGWQFSPRSGLSFEELRNEINKIINKSPLTKQSTVNNQQSTMDELTERLAEELKNTETLNHPSTSLRTGLSTETQDWLTYTNEEYGYEIKYPQDWYIDLYSSDSDYTERGPEKDLVGGDTTWSNYPEFNFDLQNPHSDDYEEVRLWIWKNEENLNIEEFVNKYKLGKIHEIKQTDNNDFHYFINNNDGLIQGIASFYKKDTKIYFFRSGMVGDYDRLPLSNKNQGSHLKILSTFKFLE